jgi:LPS O-antigen subunit length determinant protein (WzzB/FepE family)
MKLSLKKAYFGSTLALVPADNETNEYCKKLSLTDVLLGAFSKPRNYKYHRKYFSLLNTAFDIWDAPLETELHGQLVEVEKDFDEFREDIIILAGFYRIVAKPNGEVTYRAKSIKFSSMTEDKFQRLFSNTINAIIKHIIPDNQPEAEYMAMFQRILDYD